MDYFEVSCVLNDDPESGDILTAYLAEIGYSMFEDSRIDLKAYIASDIYNETELNNLLESGSVSNFIKSYKVTLIPSENWNKKWEENFSPVTVSNRILIRAEYHSSQPGFEYELVIQPRMAFGTGHHATTALVLEYMLERDFQGKNVLDMGCGTGILAIMAVKLGAAHVTAIDIDPNSTENTLLNAGQNNTPGIEVITGGAAEIRESVFDVIIANINRNIILEDLHLYSKALAKGGTLITSGYYMPDLERIREEAEIEGLQLISSKELDNWCAAVFEN